ncbi:MAG: hypothetical protein U0835_13150 [Isosphaeraceae bacterium]
MTDDLRYTLPVPPAQPWLDAERGRPLNRRSILRKVAAAAAAGAGSGAGFEILWPGRAQARVFKGTAEKGWGSVKGTVVWPKDGPAPPKPRQIDLDKFNLPAADLKWFTSKGPIYAEDWVIDEKSLGIKWAFVWLMPSVGGAAAKLPVHPSLEKPAGDTVTMEQPCSGFAPHAVALRQGQKLVVTNQSPVVHAFQWAGMLQNGNQAMPPGSKITVGDLLAHRQALRVSCAPHPWEGAWLRVFDHPYFTLTDAEGRFEIPNAPEGEHRMVVWHESAGWLGGASGRVGQNVLVEGGGVLDVGRITMKARPA